MFLMGLILMLLPSSLFESISGTTFTFPAWMHSFSRILAIVGAVIILVMSGRGRKNWAIRIALGAYDLYGVTSWLSDVLSYSRLLALGLATGVIASVINMMGSMFGSGVVKVIIFIVVFLLGHTLNIAINALGAYVHTNRLQYVEFFGKFYDAGGRKFNPFRHKNKYIQVKEGN
jgi:V/A-type H+-transporting ATPase subunit I